MRMTRNQQRIFNSGDVVGAMYLKDGIHYIIAMNGRLYISLKDRCCLIGTHDETALKDIKAVSGVEYTDIYNNLHLFKQLNAYGYVRYINGTILFSGSMLGAYDNDAGLLGTHEFSVYTKTGINKKLTDVTSWLHELAPQTVTCEEELKNVEMFYSLPIVGAFYLKDRIHYITYDGERLYTEYLDTICEIVMIPIKDEAVELTRKEVEDRVTEAKSRSASGLVHTSNYTILFNLDVYLVIEDKTGEVYKTGKYTIETCIRNEKGSVDVTSCVLKEM